jgi:nucleotide-binding universal stress UspA family protein
VLHVLEPADGAADPDAAAAGRRVLDAALADAGLVDGAPVPGSPAQGGPGEAGVGGPAGTAGVAGPARTAHLVRTHLLTGDPATMLIGASTRARLLVIGPSGTDGRFGALLGAVAQTVLRRSACPTVFVHGSRTAARGPAEPPEGRAQPPNG